MVNLRERLVRFVLPLKSKKSHIHPVITVNLHTTSRSIQKHDHIFFMYLPRVRANADEIGSILAIFLGDPRRSRSEVGQGLTHILGAFLGLNTEQPSLTTILQWACTGGPENNQSPATWKQEKKNLTRNSNIFLQQPIT